MARNRRRRTAGFSLIELMVVIAIMGLLATVVAVNLMGQTYKAKVTKVQADFESIMKACQLYKVNNYGGGRWPQKIDDLVAKGLLDNVPKDPWGNEYRYEAPIGGGVNQKPKLTCYGEDGAPGGTGESQDLTSDNVADVVRSLEKQQ